VSDAATVSSDTASGNVQAAFPFWGVPLFYCGLLREEKRNFWTALLWRV